MNCSVQTNETVVFWMLFIPPPPSGYTVEYLKSVGGQAKIYIRPLQKYLDLAPAEGEGTVSVIYALCSVFIGGLSHNRSFVLKKFARAVGHPSLLVSYAATFHLILMQTLTLDKQHHHQAHSRQNCLLLPLSLM